MPGGRLSETSATRNSGKSSLAAERHLANAQRKLADLINENPRHRR